MEQFITFFSEHWFLSGAWLVVAILLVIAQIQHLTHGIKSLVPQQLTHLINREEGVVLDIRPIADFNKGFIPGAINMPQSKVESGLKELEKYQDKPIIVVCANGMQAGSIAQKLKKAQFSSVHKLAGGFTAWLGDNLPVIKK